MRRFEYHGEEDFIPSILFRLQCAMEKMPGIVTQNDKEYHVDSHGKYVESPPFHTDTKDLLMKLVIYQKRQTGA